MEEWKLDGLACMVIHRAVIDATRGSSEAEEWLLTTGLAWCDTLDVGITEEDIKSRLTRKCKTRRFIRHDMETYKDKH